MSEPKGQRSRQGGGTLARAAGRAQVTTQPPRNDGPSPSPRRREQVWAARAWAWVDLATRGNAKLQKRYSTLARKLPSYLQVNGLGQTMAFLFSGAGEEGGNVGTPEQMLCNQLGTYLREVLERPATQPATAGEIMNFVITLKSDEYRRASREAMGVSQWLKRFAEGRFGKEQDDE